MDVRVALWTVVIPVKALPGAKTRLAGDVATPADLAVAFLRDTLTAVLATPEVVRTVVVTCDATVWALALEAGATVVDDSAHPGINPAARHGAEERAPGSGLAVLVSDLPCLVRECDSESSLGNFRILAHGSQTDGGGLTDEHVRVIEHPGDFGNDG